jgi:hypothetical protein
MPKPKLLTEKRLIQFDAVLAQKIEDFRFRERFTTESAAIRELIARGLNASSEKGPLKAFNAEPDVKPRGRKPKVKR